MKHVFRGAMVVAAGLAMLWGGMALAGPTDADKCYADKIKRAGWYNFCRMKAEWKGVKKSEAPDITKFDDKIVEKFRRPRRSGGGVPDVGRRCAHPGPDHYRHRMCDGAACRDCRGVMQ